MIKYRVKAQVSTQEEWESWMTINPKINEILIKLGIKIISREVLEEERAVIIIDEVPSEDVYMTAVKDVSKLCRDNGIHENIVSVETIYPDDIEEKLKKFDEQFARCDP